MKRQWFFMVGLLTFLAGAAAAAEATKDVMKSIPLGACTPKVDEMKQTLDQNGYTVEWEGFSGDGKMYRYEKGNDWYFVGVAYGQDVPLRIRGLSSGRRDLIAAERVKAVTDTRS